MIGGMYIKACADTTIEVNGTIEGTVVAGSTVDVQLSDSGGVVTPTSVTQVGNDLQIVLPDAPIAVTRSTATLMKTGQTTSYRTGDDGDLEAGRGVSFSVLAENNPFGTTNRFTDELGGQTYTNNIIIDWSTYNNVDNSVLGYRRTILFNTYSAIETALNSLNVGGYTGWRIPNINELSNLAVKNGGNSFNYSPLNVANGIYFFSSTLTSSTFTLVVLNINYEIIGSLIGANRGCIPVRNFTVSGTSLT